MPKVWCESNVRLLASASSSSATVDPFASSVASLLGLSFPLSLEAQSLLLSLLGVYVLFTILLAVLLVLYGMGACFEGSTLCCFPQSGGTGFTVLDEKTDMEAAAFQALAKAELVDDAAIGMLPPPEETVLPLRQSAVSAAAGQRHSRAPSSPSADDGTLDAVVAFAPAASPGRSPPHQPGLLPGGGYFEAAPTARSLLNGKSLPMPKSTPTSAADADYTGNTTVTTRFADAANSVPSALPPYNAMHSDTYHEMAKAEARAAARFGASGCGSKHADAAAAARARAVRVVRLCAERRVDGEANGPELPGGRGRRRSDRAAHCERLRPAELAKSQRRGLCRPRFGMAR